MLEMAFSCHILTSCPMRDAPPDEHYRRMETPDETRSAAAFNQFEASGWEHRADAYHRLAADLTTKVIEHQRGTHRRIVGRVQPLSDAPHRRRLEVHAVTIPGAFERELRQPRERGAGVGSQTGASFVQGG